jgi:succinoglycan biosynthesis protein ExoV
MKLLYFESDNFGDALNPFIFNYFFPDFFDDDPTTVFIGIGSVLGFIHPLPETKKAIVFSSGYAYDDVPTLDGRYDVRCVRGPGTAKALGINASMAATDGAILLRAMPQFNDAPAKKYKYCFVPHYFSLDFFDDWELLLKESDIEFVNPLSDISLIIDKIRQSEVVFAESLHAAIVADTFRVPWVPVSMYSHINKFKWQDWYDSINLGIYEPVELSRLYNKVWRRKNIAHATKLGADNLIVRFMAILYRWYHLLFQRSKSLNEFKKLKGVNFKLSNEVILDARLAQLLQIINEIKSDYGETKNRDE